MAESSLFSLVCIISLQSSSKYRQAHARINSIGGWNMSIGQAELINELMAILDETFESHHGIYLDKGTSLFETLATIDATQASIPVGSKCASLAAQVAHIIVYLEVI